MSAECLSFRAAHVCRCCVVVGCPLPSGRCRTEPSSDAPPPTPLCAVGRGTPQTPAAELSTAVGSQQQQLDRDSLDHRCVRACCVLALLRCMPCLCAHVLQQLQECEELRCRPSPICCRLPPFSLLLLQSDDGQRAVLAAALYTLGHQEEGQHAQPEAPV